ncbi:MAG: LysM peptidoglycan-binding domain-containing protein [Caldilinea sp. CFX5]|nr:LysM peptidoglycan-binding domain-containing protein [Caldilinea sp. CFX5]
MQKARLHKLFTAVAVALSLVVAFTTLVGATGAAAPVNQATRAKEVRGTLPGGQFAQIWLGLEPEFSGAQISVVAEWDRENPANSGLNFFILDDQAVRRVGEASLSSLAVAAGSANYIVNAPSNQLGASLNAIGLAKYTLVVANDSSQDANFTLRVTNGFITDESNQVVNPNAPVTTTTTTTTTATVAAPTATPTAAAAVTTTASTTATRATAPTAAPTTAPAAPTVGQITVVTGTTLSGDLPNQDDQHFLGLQPDGSDVQITLRLTFDPQDNSELARRLNFWVLTAQGLQQIVNGSAEASDIAIAAGNRVFRGQNNERVASFRSSGTGAFTVIVYNNATVPGSYNLTVEGGTLIDDAAQTKEGKAGIRGVSVTGPVTGTTTSAVTATTTSTTTTATGRTGEPGGTYTVKAGDTLALIARDIYGDFRLYEQLCAFNNIANCNVIEIGDVIRLPTRAQLTSTAPAPTPTPAPAVRATTTTTATAPVRGTTAVTATNQVTRTGAVTATTGVTPTTTTTRTGQTTGNAATGSQSIYDILAANNNYSTLVKALDTTGLASSLDGAGQFTLFAPTNAAFNALRNQFNLTEDRLLALPELADTLRYHVLNSKTSAESITNGMKATTLQGKQVTFEIDGTGAKINGANIIATDIQASNGVIHVIDAVIIPPPQ